MASTPLPPLPPPPPLRQVTIPSGTLLGFKACPGNDAKRLLKHASIDPGESVSLWSGIYVQLSLAQAIHYAPNQYDRGEDTCCICTIVTKQPLNVAISEDLLMADVSISSTDKAGRILWALEETPLDVLGFRRIPGEYHPSVVGFFGSHDCALCLLDCETYELALPHALFTENRFHFETVLVFPKSTLIPGGVIGGMEFLPDSGDDDNDKDVDPQQRQQQRRVDRRAVHEALPTLRRSELADAASLGSILEERFETHNLLPSVRADWLPQTP